MTFFFFPIFMIITQSDIDKLPEKAFHEAATMKAMVAGSPLVRNPPYETPSSSARNVSVNSVTSINSENENNGSSQNNNNNFSSPVISENRVPVPIPRKKKIDGKTVSSDNSEKSIGGSKDNLTLVQPRDKNSSDNKSDFQEKNLSPSLEENNSNNDGSNNQESVAFQFTM